VAAGGVRVDLTETERLLASLRDRDLDDSDVYSECGMCADCMEEFQHAYDWPLAQDGQPALESLAIHSDVW